MRGDNERERIRARGGEKGETSIPLCGINACSRPPQRIATVSVHSVILPIAIRGAKEKEDEKRGEKR